MAVGLVVGLVVGLAVGLAVGPAVGSEAVWLAVGFVVWLAVGSCRGWQEFVGFSGGTVGLAAGHHFRRARLGRRRVLACAERAPQAERWFGAQERGYVGWAA